MEVIGWPDKMFHEIPKQDNPAFDKTQEGVMICKDHQPSRLFVVLMVKDQKVGGEVVERVLHIAKFWDYHLAVRFAEAFASWPTALHEALVSEPRN